MKQQQNNPQNWKFCLFFLIILMMLLLLNKRTHVSANRYYISRVGHSAQCKREKDEVDNVQPQLSIFEVGKES